MSQDQTGSAAAIILSGTGTDGTRGIQEIKAHNGLVLAQSADSATYDGMPQSAVNTGLVDTVLAPEKMPATLVRYFSHPGARLAAEPTTITTDKQQEWLHKIFAILRTRVGHDFSAYKTNTLLRRISRRLALHQIETPELYLNYMRQHPGEAEALFKELLIGVTSFFRDGESFQTLKARILPALFQSKPQDATFRVWVPGCSTGEMASSSE